MKKYNKHGFISGGFIYDQLDRLSQTLVEKISDKEYNFTRWGFCVYEKQLCNDKDFYLGFSYYKKIPFIKNTYIAKVYMKNKQDIRLAKGWFCFKGKEKNYCERKIG